MATKSRAQQKRDTKVFGFFLMAAGGVAFFAMFGVLQIPLKYGIAQGTMRGGVAYYVPAGTTAEKPVLKWFHESGRANLQDGDHVPVILYADGGHASTKSPYLLALLTGLGGLAAIGIGYVFMRFA